MQNFTFCNELASPCAGRSAVAAGLLTAFTARFIGLFTKSICMTLRKGRAEMMVEQRSAFIVLDAYRSNKVRVQTIDCEDTDLAVAVMRTGNTGRLIRF